MRGFFGKAIPGMIASAGPQLLIVAGAIIASASPSAVSWLYFANRLIELPLGIVGVAMGTVLVPELTRALRSDDRTSMAHVQSRGLELAVGLALPATLSVSNALQLLKGGSSKWIKDTFPELRGFGWQDGYGAFTVCKSHLPDVIGYIQNQREHHRVKTFKEEFLAFLTRHEIDFDQRFLWG